MASYWTALAPLETGGAQAGRVPALGELDVEARVLVALVVVDVVRVEGEVVAVVLDVLEVGLVLLAVKLVPAVDVVMPPDLMGWVVVARLWVDPSSLGAGLQACLVVVIGG